MLLGFAQNAHKGQLRGTGESFFTHPVSVAQILSNLNLDLNTIITGLLHDVVEDCGYLYLKFLQFLAMK